MNRKYSLDFLKIVGIIYVVFHHAQSTEAKIIYNGYMFVEMFFIISGFFLFKSILEKNQNLIEFIISRLKKLYLPYILALFSLVIIFLIVGQNLNYSKWWSIIFEIFMLQNVGLPGSGGINYPCWYLSVLLYGSIIIFILIKKLGIKRFNTISFVIVFLFYMYSFIEFQSLEQWGYIFKFFYYPFIRGSSAMVLGGIIYQLSNRIKSIDSISNMLIVSIFFMIIVLMFINIKLDFILLILFFVIILLLIISKDNIFDKIGNCKVLKMLESYEYYMFINHALVIYFVKYIKKAIDINYFIYIFLLFGILFIFSFIMKIMVKKIEYFINKRKVI